jgi:hypothetical protein
MIPLETQIFRLIFPPAGAIPLARINAIPQIRSHIAAILSLADGQSVRSAGDSRAITQRIVELHDKGVGWAEMAPEFALSANACQKRYTKFMKDQEETIRDQIGHIEPFVGGILASESIHTNHLPKTETEPLQEAEPINPEKPPEQEKKPDEVATIREFRTVEKPAPLDPDAFNVVHVSTSGEFATIREIGLAGKPVDAVGAGVLEERSEVRTVEKPAPLDPETRAEVDRMLGEGMAVKEISAELEKNGRPVPWTKIRARTAYLARMKSKEAKPELEKADEPEPAAAQPEEEPQEAEATDDRPEPVSISRKELDLRIWDMWKAGETLDGISDILYSEGLYYSAKSVRVRLLSQGAKL